VIDLADPFCTLILQGIERRLLQTPYLPIIMDAHNQPNQVERYINMMLERRVEGLITVANWLLFDISALEDVGDSLPTFVVGRDIESPTLSFVSVDNEAGGYTALEHLYKLGHREIAFVRGPRRLVDSRLRWKGIRSFARKAGLRLNPNLIKSLPDTFDSISSFEGSREITNSYIHSGERFTALLAFDDVTAYGAIRALSENGKRVPEDCSVIGFDDIPAASLSTPGLTTVRQPMLSMGELGADYILKILENSEDNQKQAYGQNRTMPAELAIRGSTARAASLRKSK
jgi:LacI family transcriptional regulator